MIKVEANSPLTIALAFSWLALSEFFLSLKKFHFGEQCCWNFHLAYVHKGPQRDCKETVEALWLGAQALEQTALVSPEAIGLILRSSVSLFIQRGTRMVIQSPPGLILRITLFMFCLCPWVLSLFQRLKS